MFCRAEANDPLACPRPPALLGGAVLTLGGMDAMYLDSFLTTYVFAVLTSGICWLGGNLVMLKVVLEDLVEGKWPTQPKSWPIAALFIIGGPGVIFAVTKILHVRDPGKTQRER